MDQEFQKNVNILLDDDREFLFPHWIRAAEYFLSQVIAGKNIQEALEGLGRVFEESHQVPVMEPAMGAIIRQLMRMKNPGGLDRFMGTKDSGFWVFEALHSLARKGARLELFLPGMIKHFSLNPSTAAKTLAALLKSSNPQELAMISQVLVQANGGEMNLFPFLYELPGLNLSPALESLKTLILNPEIRDQALEKITTLAERNPGLAGLERALKNELQENSPDRNQTIGYCLWHIFENTPEPERLSEVMNHPWASVRLGVLKALDYRGLGTVEKVDRVALFLLDPDPELKNKAMGILKRNLDQGPLKGPSPKVLKILIDSPGGITGPVGDLLVQIGSQKGQTAVKIKNILQARRDRPGARERLEALDSMGTRTPCSICSHLSRQENWNHELSLPPQVKKLVSSGGFRLCPECGNTYEYSYEDEYDDMSHLEYFSLRRLHPGDLLSRLTGTDLKGFLQSFEEQIPTLQKDLQHPFPFLKSEAAWKLTHFSLGMNRSEEVCSLATSPDPVLRQEVFLALVEDFTGQDHSAYLGLWERALEDPNPEVRKYAAQAFSRFRLNRGQDVDRLLTLEDGDVLAGTLTTIYQKGHQGPYRADLNRISALAFHQDSRVRNLVQWIRTQAKEKELPVPTLVAQCVEKLDSPREEIRKEALITLEGSSPGEWAEVIIAAAGRCLGHPATTYHAVILLQRYGSMGLDLSGALGPVLSPWAIPDYRGERLGLISYFIQTGTVVPEFIAIALEGLGDSRLVPNACEVFRTLAEKGEDLTSAAGGIVDFLNRSGGADSYTESLVALLLKSYWKHNNIPGMESLILNQKTAHRLSAVYGLEQMVQEKFDLRPLAEILERNLRDRSTRVQELTRRILTGGLYRP